MPISVNVVRHNYYKDSIQLMRLTEEAKHLEGVIDAAIVMGTETNKLLLKQLGLLAENGVSAGENDLILAVKAKSRKEAETLTAKLDGLVLSPTPRAGKGRTYFTIESALEGLPDANLALVSVPGQLASSVAMELLKRGLNVHLFSDHVPIREEVRLKKYAVQNGLLLLGPGAGTSIINGVGLGFSNVVRAGNVGIVAAAGTGLQEVSVLLDRAGSGVSHALGVGGSDLTNEVNGMMTLRCMELLEEDSSTSVILLVAKQPEAAVMDSVMDYIEKKVTKPVVACMLGLTRPSTERVKFAKTLHAAAFEASKLSAPTTSPPAVDRARLVSHARKLRRRLRGRRRFVRGLYSGGTLAHEALLIFKELVEEPYSNTPLSRDRLLSDPLVSKEHTIVDLGDEFFTAGRAHPMIDPTLRKVRLEMEASDPEVGVIMADVVLGHGTAPDPAGSLAESVKASRNRSRVIFMAHICGTPSDPQSLDDQERKLSEIGVLLYDSNALMAVEAALVVGGETAASRLGSKWDEFFGR